MTAALRLLQDVRPTPEPRLWSCYSDPAGRIRQNLSRDEIACALTSGVGTLWVDVDTRDKAQEAILGETFHFHPLAIQEAVNPQSTLKLEEFDQCLPLSVCTVPFCESTADLLALNT